jgi:putative ABC transport system permease protein
MRAALLIAASLFGRESLRSIRRTKLRSSLCALGITIGIAAVVSVVAIGRAGSARSEEQLRNLGDNFIWVEAGSRAPSGVRTGTHGTNTLTLEDAKAILRDVPLLKSMSPHVDAKTQIIYGHKNWNTHWRGVTSDYLDIRRWYIERGDVFTDADCEQVNNVAVIGHTVRDQIFGAEDPVGKTVRIGGHLFRVIGLLAPKGQSASGQDQDDTVLMPYTTGQKKILGRYYTYLDDIMFSAVSQQAVKPAIAQIESLMRQRHHIQPDQDDDFNIRKPDEIIKVQLETSNTIAVLLIAIASISLVVGGIGIMNVMLVSVAERTREIGLRLAVGATGSAVQMQFLGEAVMISLLGGVLGIALGVATSTAIARVLEWPLRIPPEALALAPLFSISVGVIFGYYPARRASQLDPIDALRYE